MVDALVEEVAERLAATHSDGALLAYRAGAAHNYWDQLARAAIALVGERCALAINEARTKPIHSASVEYVNGVRLGHDRSITAIRSLTGATNDG